MKNMSLAILLTSTLTLAPQAVFASKKKDQSCDQNEKEVKPSSEKVKSSKVIKIFILER
ncbi:MAG: hypothetical protein Fur0010_28180 [Bdellovibrio sp.]